MAKHIPKYEVPYTSSGNIYQPSRWNDMPKDLVWKPNTIIHLTVTIEDDKNSGYSTQILAKAKDGRKFYFSPKTLVSTIKKYDVIGGTISGDFIISKQGNHYVLDVLESQKQS